MEYVHKKMLFVVERGLDKFVVKMALIWFGKNTLFKLGVRQTINLDLVVMATMRVKALAAIVVNNVWEVLQLMMPTPALVLRRNAPKAQTQDA